MIFPQHETFHSLIQRHKTVPVYCQFTETHLTPIGVFEHLQPLSPQILLESGHYSTDGGRYSYIGLQLTKQTQETSQLKDLEIMDHNSYFDELLPPFYNGYIGYVSFAYTKALFNLGELTAPPYQLYRPKIMVIIDHLRSQVSIVYNAHQHEYDQAKAAILDIRQLILAQGAYQEVHSLPGQVHFGSNMSKQGFMDKVKQAKEHIIRGDIFQVVLSQRFTAKVQGLDSFALYKQVKAENASPYLCYMQLDDRTIICSSPEMLFKHEQNMIETVPIAGTRKVCHDGKDHQRAYALLHDEKELAEHLMLVDLGRNDLGRVSLPGSVHVSRYGEVKQLSSVMHLVSHVKGRLDKSFSPLEGMLACFPAGTVSGAPKKRALEIIDTLEDEPRDLYAGAIFYLNTDGAINSCISIRTIEIQNDSLTIQAGAGIVYDSNPASEYQETINKARALFTAVGRLYEGGISYDFDH